MYLLFLLWLVLFKFSLHIVETFNFPIRGLNWIPFAEVSENWKDVIYNCLFFVPLGMLLAVNFKQATFWRKLGYIFWFSLAVEVSQYITAIGITDVTDLLTNTAGGFVGLTLYSVNRRYFNNKLLDQWVVGVIGVLAVALSALIFTFQHNRDRQPPGSHTQSQAQTTNSQLDVQDIQLAWPAVGQAAVSNVEDNVLVRSSKHETPRPMASMAKVITALAILEKQSLKSGQTGPTYTITTKDVAYFRAEAARGGSTVAVREGMTLTQYQALQVMLVASSNNMARTLAERTFGSEEAYVAYAQDMLKRMGLAQTMVADASGFSSATMSTPSELVVIGSAALKQPVIAEIVAQPRVTVPGIGTLTNTNELLGTQGVVGIKTGTNDEAGSCLLFAARYSDKDGNEKTIVGVIMGDTDHKSLYEDSRQLLVSARQSFGLGNPEPKRDTNAPRLGPRDRQ